LFHTALAWVARTVRSIRSIASVIAALVAWLIRRSWPLVTSTTGLHLITAFAPLVPVVAGLVAPVFNARCSRGGVAWCVWQWTLRWLDLGQCAPADRGLFFLLLLLIVLLLFIVRIVTPYLRFRFWIGHRKGILVRHRVQCDGVGILVGVTTGRFAGLGFQDPCDKVLLLERIGLFDLELLGDLLQFGQFHLAKRATVVHGK